MGGLMCTNLSLLHAAGRVTDGGAGRRGEGDGPPPPPGPGRSWKFAPQENDGHLPVSRQGSHCLARAETQDISWNQHMPGPGPACLPLRLARGWKATLSVPHRPDVARPTPPHTHTPMHSPARSVA